MCGSSLARMCAGFGWRRDCHRKNSGSCGDRPDLRVGRRARPEESDDRSCGEIRPRPRRGGGRAAPATGQRRMTDESSPFYSYDRSSVGWLYPRKERGLDILNEDLARIVEANVDLVPDPLLRELIVEGLRGQLHAKRGRKRLPSRIARDLYIVSLYDDLLPRLQARAASPTRFWSTGTDR